MKQVLLSVFFAFVLVACDDVFDAPPKAFLNATLKYTDNEKDKSIKQIGVSVFGEGRTDAWIFQDTLAVSSSDSTRSVLIPLNDTPTTDYVFTLNGIADTVSISADSKLIYESMETGFYTEFKITGIEYTRHRIDNIEVLDSAVTKEWNENIIININTLTYN